MVQSLPPERAAKLRAFLNRHGLAVADLELVDCSLTHSSYAFENERSSDNERLEFLGDAVLGLLVSDYLYHEHPRSREGVLSKHKAALISRSLLGKRAHDLGLGDLLLLGHGEEAGGGRERLSLLGSALEALVGALFLQLGLVAIEGFVEREVFVPGRQLSETSEFGDYKSRLQELVQKLFQVVPEYEVISESGPDHDKRFEVAVRVDGLVRGRGTGSRKKSAENRAAMEAFWALSEGHTPDSR